MAVSGPHPSGLRDNHSRGTVADFLEEGIRAGSSLSIVSAYFTIHAYDALKSALDQIEHLDFLFGEPSFVNRLDPDKTEKKSFLLKDDGLKLGSQLQQRRVARDCAAWIERKVDIKTVRQSNLLHGKMYHIDNGGVEDAILGSSNFTVRGLGLAQTGNNIELNLIVDSNRDRQELKQWFSEIWDDQSLVQDVKGDVLQYLQRLYANQSPQFIYYLTLFHLFRDFLDGNRDIDDALRRLALPDTDIWKALFSFQKDGAKAASNKILNYNGCILADSVGLGKTYTALAVIKYFELRNERVLVLCPKKLRRNWTVYRSNSTLNPFAVDRFRFDVLHHTDLSRTGGESNGIDLADLNWSVYDLVVIDESHNFRNNKLATQRAGDTQRRRSRYQRLMEDIISTGVRTKVLLLSATPVNNQLSDLRNQISFIAGDDVARNDTADTAFNESLKIQSVKETTRQAQAHFTIWAKKPVKQRKTRDLISAIGGDFFKLLDGLSIARSRRQVSSYYADEIKNLGGFPKRPPPKAIHAPIDLSERFLSFEQLDQEISNLRLVLYHPSSFLRDDLPPKTLAAYEDRIHGGFTQEGRERILIAMMKVNFLKRLESSVDSFRLTLVRTIQKIDQLEKKITEFEEHLNDAPEIDCDSLTPEEFEDPDFDQEDFTIGGRRRIHLGHLKLPEWLKEVRNDRTQLQYLLEKTQAVTVERDGKLAELKTLINSKVRKPTTNRDSEPNRKVLIFTAFADTARYLYKHLHTWAQTELGIDTALVCGDGGNATSLGRTDYDDILTNFSPRVKRRAEQKSYFGEQTAEIDLLIATDCISEGQNLQDCDLLINYDIHWNPVRIIQRFGRIDRIGSRKDKGFQRNRSTYGVDNLFRYEEHFRDADSALAHFDNIPFLNGGLFECLDRTDPKTDKKIYVDGFWRNKKKRPYVPNHLFFSDEQIVDLSDAYGERTRRSEKVRGLLRILNSYKFTIIENTPIDQEIALDPELLGKVFENLLASYNEETKTTARKQTGSFYTPRPIVEYMVDQSLLAHLTTALTKSGTSEDEARDGLEILFAYTERPHPFNNRQVDTLLDAIHTCKILDPACGSGAFPMGMLQKLVYIIHKLDPNNAKWKQLQIDKASEIPDSSAREAAIKAIKQDFADNEDDYGRKLYLIENCLYGVDIQSIAIQISKLRFFISLVCDQKTNRRKKDNLGIRPLPNLETRFVAADTLISLKKDPQKELFESVSVRKLESELQRVRHDHFAATTRQKKLSLQKRDREIRDELAKELEQTAFYDQSAARKLANWDPYDPQASADYFEPLWMFDQSLIQGFDLIVGNPPYISVERFAGTSIQAKWQQDYSTYAARGDIYGLFYERGASLLRDGGSLVYITSNKWMRAGYGKKLRALLSSAVNTEAVLDFGMAQNFGAATTYTCIVRFSKTMSRQRTSSCYAADDRAAMADPAGYFSENRAVQTNLSSNAWVVLSKDRQRIKDMVEVQGIPLEDWNVEINYGIKTGFNEAFYLTAEQRETLIAEDPKSDELIGKLARGRDIQRYGVSWPNTYQLIIPFGAHGYPSRIQTSMKTMNWMRRPETV